MTLGAVTDQPPDTPFRHEAVMYGGEREFVDVASSFIRDGLRADEPILVVVSDVKIRLLQDDLGLDADSVCFADMAEVGRNPARIIPAWRDFVEEHATSERRFRGIGEPIGPDRSTAALAECHRHEALLNVAFDEAPAWWLLCPYDASALEPAVLEEARRNHPFVSEGGIPHESPDYRGLEALGGVFADPLPAPPVTPVEVTFEAGLPLTGVRRTVTDYAARAGLPPDRIDDLVLAVNELATNSLRHGGGHGTLRLWQDADAVVCEVQDGGSIGDALVGRARPGQSQTTGRGLWLVHQLCDLVQLRSLPTGTIARLHIAGRRDAG